MQNGVDVTSCRGEGEMETVTLCLFYLKTKDIITTASPIATILPPPNGIYIIIFQLG